MNEQDTSPPADGAQAVTIRRWWRRVNWDDPSVPAGDSPPMSSWPTWVAAACWCAWLLFLLFMAWDRIRSSGQ